MKFRGALSANYAEKKKLAKLQVYAPVVGRQPVTPGWLGDWPRWWGACLHIHQRWQGAGRGDRAAFFAWLL